MPATYVSIDVETTGLNPETCQILQFAAVVETVGSAQPVTDLPTFSCVVLSPTYGGDPYALHLNSGILKQMLS